MATGTFKDYKAVITARAVDAPIAVVRDQVYSARAINTDDLVTVTLQRPDGRITQDEEAEIYSARVSDLCEILVNLATGEKRLYVKEGIPGSECEGA